MAVMAGRAFLRLLPRTLAIGLGCGFGIPMHQSGIGTQALSANCAFGKIKGTLGGKEEEGCVAFYTIY
jgi:hypothetical protein